MKMSTEPSATIADFLAQVEFLSALQADEREQLAEQAQSKWFDLGESVVNAGDPAEGIFVVRSGMVRIFKEIHGKEISLGLLKEGEVIGEIAARRDYRHEYSVRASAKTELLYLPRAAFQKILAHNRQAASFMGSYAAIRAAGGIISQLFNLRGKVEQQQLRDLIASVGIKRIEAGEVILNQDSREDHRLYVMRQGQVRLLRKEAGAEYTVARLEAGEIFGEKACLLGQEQQVTVSAETDTVVFVIPEATIKSILEHNPKVREIIEERIQIIDREIERQRKLAERKPTRVLLDLVSKPKLGERIIRRFPLVHQAEEADCGAACLAMICKHHDVSMTLGKLRELANVTRQGATMDSLARVGELLGFSTRGVKCSYQVLQSFDLPFIAHWEGYHYVVVYGISKRNVWLADPGPGFRKLTAAEFEKGWTGNCLLFKAGSELAETAPSQSPWARFIDYLRPYKGILIHLVLATLVIQVLSVVPPVITQNILDQVIVHHDTELLTLLLIGYILTIVFSQLATVLRAFLSNFMVRNLDFSMMSRFSQHVMSLPLSFFAKRRTGDILARFKENRTIRAFLTESTISTVLNVLMAFIYFTVLFIYSTKLTLILIAFIIPIIALTVFVTPRIKRFARDVFEASTDAESLLMETVSGAETVKGMGAERDMRLKWERKYARALDVQYRAERYRILFGAVSQILNTLTTVAILGVGALMILNQEFTVGQLIAFNMLMGSAMSPLMGLVGLWDQLHEAGIAMERLGDVLDIKPEQTPTELPSRIVLPELNSHIRFEDVYFRYGGNETPFVLEKLNFEVNPGDLVAIVGQSGSGKTTLAKLIVGFFQPTEGQVHVDGYDLNLIDKETYRAQIGYVMQSNLLFSGTIVENIAMGDPNPDRRQIMEVAKLADAHGFIASMPLGYEQKIGERGLGLSGGQVQRICIARALYKNPRLIIFDEATSALDAQSESNILNNMHLMLQGRTAIVIAHRLSTVMRADKILVLYKGAIIEAGQHQELVERKGMYHELFKKQMASV